MQGMMNGGMHTQATRAQMLQQQQQPHRMPQYGNGMMYGGNPGIVMMPQQQQQTIGVRRSAAHLNAGSGMHPEEPATKRYRKVISNVSAAGRPHMLLFSCNVRASDRATSPSWRRRAHCAHQPLVREQICHLRP